MPKIHTSGHVLLMVLIILTLISLLSLNQYQQLLLQFKAQNQRQQYHKTRKELGIIALKLIRQAAPIQCLKAGWHSSDSKKKFSAADACIIKENSMNYMYLWEKLSEEPCLQLKRGQSAALYRLSVKKPTHNLIIQMHLLRKGKSATCNAADSRNISNALLSLQFISL